jgi:hypothetical protein
MNLELFHTYVTKPQMVKAKIWAKGDETGIYEGPISTKRTTVYIGEIPYLDDTPVGRQYAEFGTHYLVLLPDFTKQLIPKQKFEEKYENLDA